MKKVLELLESAGMGLGVGIAKVAYNEDGFAINVGIQRLWGHKDKELEKLLEREILDRAPDYNCEDCGGFSNPMHVVFIGVAEPDDMIVWTVAFCKNCFKGGGR